MKATRANTPSAAMHAALIGTPVPNKDVPPTPKRVLLPGTLQERISKLLPIGR